MDARREELSGSWWRDGNARVALERYQSTIAAVARRLTPLASRGRGLDAEDLKAEGRVAVLEALNTYQGFGIKESTWVRTRIRQRMIDAIRRMDLGSRGEMRAALRLQVCGTGEGVERESARRVAARRLVSMDTAAGDSEPMVARLVDMRTPAPDTVVEGRLRGQQLVGAMAKLPGRQRRAIELGLFEGMALREIGERMGISESRACQLQKRAVTRLRRELADREERIAA